MGTALAEAPAGLLQVVVDVGLAGGELGQVFFWPCGGLVGLAQGGDLRPQPFQFLLGGDGDQALVAGLALLGGGRFLAG